MLFAFAFKNMWRRKVRTFLTCGSVGLALWAAVLFVGLREHAYETLVNLSAKAGYGHLTIAAKGFLDNLGGSVPLVEFDNDVLYQAVKGMCRVLPRVFADGSVQSSGRTQAAYFWGVDPDKESTGTNVYFESVTEGEAPYLAEKSSCMVGQLLLNRLRLQLGDEVIYTIANQAGQLSSYSCVARSSFVTGNTGIDAHTVVLPRVVLATNIGGGQGQASFYALYTNKDFSINELASSLSKIMAGSHLEAFHWRHTQPGLWGYILRDSLMFRMTLVLGFVIIGAGMFSTMIIAILERKKEIGTMLAMGMLPRELVLSFFIESFYITTLGVLMGSLILLPFIWYFTEVGLDVGRIFDLRMNIGGVFVNDMVLFIRMNLTNNVVIVAMLYVLTALATVYPARKALNTDPIKMIRGD